MYIMYYNGLPGLNNHSFITVELLSNIHRYSAYNIIMILTVNFNVLWDVGLYKLSLEHACQLVNHAEYYSLFSMNNILLYYQA